MNALHLPHFCLIKREDVAPAVGSLAGCVVARLQSAPSKIRVKNCSFALHPAWLASPNFGPLAGVQLDPVEELAEGS